MHNINVRVGVPIPLEQRFVAQMEVAA